MANTDTITPNVVTTLPPPEQRPYPTDPDAALAIIGLGRQLERLDERMRAAWSTPGDNPRFRRLIEDWVDAMVDFLNMDTPDPDAEDGDPAEEAGDLEPSLGSLDHVTDQRRWAEAGNAGEHDLDREDEHDGREPCEDGEPSLGSADRVMDQAMWCIEQVPWFAYSDREFDPAESGIADAGGLQEQGV